MAEAIVVVGAVASIVQIINVITKSINCLSDIRSQWKDADLACLSLAAQLTTLRAALTKIHEWMDDSLGAAHHQLVMDLDVSMSCCNLLILKINSLLPDLTELTESKPDFPGKMKVLFGSRNIDEAQKLIERQTSALGLLLSACSCKTTAEQKTLLEKPKSRKQFDRIQLDSASLWVHRDTDTMRSRFTDNLSKLSMVFPFDNIVFSSNVYERVFRGSLKASLRRQQNGPTSERRKEQRKGKDTSAFLDFLGEEERPTPIIESEIEFGSMPLAKHADSALPLHLKRKLQKERIPSEYKLMLMNNTDGDVSWFLRIIEQHFPHPLTSQQEIDRTIVHCGNVLVSAMKNLAIRPEKRSNDDHYTFLTQHHPHQSFDARFVEALLSIWQDPCISTVLERSTGLPSMDIVPHFLDALAQQTSSDHILPDFQENKSDRIDKLLTHSSMLQSIRILTPFHFVGIKSLLGELSYIVGDCDTATLIIIRMKDKQNITHELNILEQRLTQNPLKNTVLFLTFVRSTALKQNLSTSPLEECSPAYFGRPAEIFISTQFETRLSENIACASEVRYIHSLWTNPEKAEDLVWSFNAMGDVYKQKALRSK